MATNGSEARNSKYVTLVSSDGHEFVVLREATSISPTIKGMLRGSFAEAKTGRCVFPEIQYVVDLSFASPMSLSSAGYHRNDDRRFLSL
jgi:hypothetical protein